MNFCIINYYYCHINIETGAMDMSVDLYSLFKNRDSLNKLKFS